MTDRPPKDKRAWRIASMDDLSGRSVPRAFVEAIPVTFARRHGIVAIGSANGSLQVATAHPLGRPYRKPVGQFADGIEHSLAKLRVRDTTGLVGRDLPQLPLADPERPGRIL